jgi:3-(3-hydroxy-phenyl)propionate hydroxylase
MTNYPSETPVVVIGAGPTGLTTALLLARYGVETLVLERNATPLDIPRAIVLDDEGARTLQVFDRAETFLAHTIVGDGAEYVDDAGQQFGRVGAGPETYGFAKRHFIDQPELENCLRETLATVENCDLHFSCEVTDLTENADHIAVTFTDPGGKTHLVKAQYVVAADGGRSPTRESLGIQMLGSTYEQDWIVIDTKNDPDQGDFSHFYCSNKRPHVSIPAPFGGRRYEFMLLPGETHEQVLDPDFVAKLLAPFRTIEDKDIIRSTIYTFHARMAERWRAGRILIAGDAAHLTPPFAGQGMNAGLRDAANISWKLASVLNGGASDAILDSYDAERRDPAWAMIQLAVAMGDIVMPIEKEQLDFREQLMRTIAPFPAVQDYLLYMKFKPRPRFDTGLFLGLKDSAFEGSIVGEMIPQPTVTQGEKTDKLDNFIGSGFALIAQDAAGAEALAALEMDTFLGQDLAKLFIPFRETSTAMPVTATDDPYAKLLRAHRDEILLIRPDRYCAAAFTPKDLCDGLTTYKRRLGA